MEAAYDACGGDVAALIAQLQEQAASL